MSKSKLSADVPCFVPQASHSYNVNTNDVRLKNNWNMRQVSMRIPTYMTNCYPFVQEQVIYSNAPWQEAVQPMSLNAVRRMAPYSSNSPAAVATVKNKPFSKVNANFSSNLNRTVPQARNVNKTLLREGRSVNESANNLNAWNLEHGHKNPEAEETASPTTARRFSARNQFPNKDSNLTRNLNGTSFAPTNSKHFQLKSQKINSNEQYKDSNLNENVYAAPFQPLNAKHLQPTPPVQISSTDGRHVYTRARNLSFRERALSNVELPDSVSVKISQENLSKPGKSVVSTQDSNISQPSRSINLNSYQRDYPKLPVSPNHKFCVSERLEASHNLSRGNGKTVEKKNNSDDVEQMNKPSKISIKQKFDRTINNKNYNKNIPTDRKISLVDADLLQNSISTPTKVLRKSGADELSISFCDEESYPSLESVYKRNKPKSSPLIHGPEKKAASHLNEGQKIAEDTTISVSDHSPRPAPMSFSDVLKTTRKPTPTCAANEIKKSTVPEPKKKSKKEKPKKQKKSNKEMPKKPRQKARSAIELDLSGFLDKIEKEKELLEEKLREGVDVPVKKRRNKETRFLAKKENVKVFNKMTPLNALDSSSPTKRGKEKETKKKKTTPLKKAILKDREARRQKAMEKNSDAQKEEEGLTKEESSKEEETNQVSDSVSTSNLALKLQEKTLPSPWYDVSPGAKALVHSRKFREYCDHYLDAELDNSIQLLLSDLIRFQDRLYHQNPVKAKAKRRMVLGLKEVTKHVKNGKIKCVIIAPNLEKSQATGGLEDMLRTLINVCKERNVPLVFALNKRKLGALCKKMVGVSCAGIFNYDGSEENFKRAMKLSNDARELYRSNISGLEADLADLHLVDVENIKERLTHLQSLSSVCDQVTSYRVAEANVNQKRALHP